MASEPSGVVHLTAEYWPYAQTGGLAEAVQGLAESQARRGMDVSVLLPLYRAVEEQTEGLEPATDAFGVPLGTRTETVRLWTHSRSAPQILFVESARYYDREGVYGHDGRDFPDNVHRFALLSRVAVETLPRLWSAPPVLHAHDWHAAPAVIYLRAADPASDFHENVPGVLTVHNAAFQGRFAPELAAEVGLPRDPPLRDRIEWDGALNFLRGGLELADRVTTVSPTHAAELRTDRGGFGLDPVYRSLGDRLTGILNGIDAERWDPASDPHLQAPYGPGKMEGKAACRTALRSRAGLPDREDVPLLCVAARLVHQKGLDLLLESSLPERPELQLVVLGSGDPAYEARLAARTSADRFVLDTRFTDEKEHAVIAGGDILLMPSVFEPCGLTQMRAQRYGTLPVARRVGGLADTIDDGVTGFLFDELSPDALEAAVDRAVAEWREPGAWSAMVRSAMERDFGWRARAAEYDAVYAEAAGARAASGTAAAEEGR